MGLSPGEALERAEKSETPVEAYTRRLVLGVGEHREEIDALLTRHLQDWSLERLAPVERSVLRTAVFEMLHVEDVPPPVAIDEAVELAKRFSSDEAGALVNGVLGGVARDLAG